jgi:hypothetical protein
MKIEDIKSLMVGDGDLDYEIMISESIVLRGKVRHDTFIEPSGVIAVKVIGKEHPVWVSIDKIIFITVDETEK